MIRNPIYFDATYFRRMRDRRYRGELVLRRWTSLLSALRSHVVMFPTRSMMEMVAAYVGGPRRGWRVIPEGTNRGLFSPGTKGGECRTPVRLLHVGLYSDQKNVSTLLCVAEELDRAQPGRYRLTLTSGLAARELDRPDTPSARTDLALLRRLAAGNVAEDVGPLPLDQIPPLYRSADIFVFPSYTESFGHPLVEAMASGLPIVAADTPVNREMCAEAAVYVPTFDVPSYMHAIERVRSDRDLRIRLIEAGLRRADEFSWEQSTRGMLEALGLIIEMSRGR